MKTPTKCIEITGRRWFQKSFGNTYHSATVALDGKQVFASAKTYGYGDQYRQTAEDWLRASGLLTDWREGESLREWCERHEVILVVNVADVSRKRDL